MNTTNEQQPEAKDIECPKCGRITFAWEKNMMCPDCHWVVRPRLVEKPFGCDVLVQVREGQGTKVIEKHYKGTPAVARKRAKNVPRFDAVLAVVPLTESQWLGAYGDGRM